MNQSEMLEKKVEKRWEEMKLQKTKNVNRR